MPRIKFFTKEILAAFQAQGNTDELFPDKIRVICKFFNPTGVGTWYCYEYNPTDQILQCFANLADPVMAECGSVSVTELQAFRGKMGLGIERDIHFPIGQYTLNTIIDTIKNGGHI